MSILHVRHWRVFDALSLHGAIVCKASRFGHSDIHGFVFILFESTPPCDAVTLFKTSAGLLALGSLLGAKCMLPEREISVATGKAVGKRG